MPGPAVRRGEAVSLHPWGDEDEAFYHEHRNLPAIRQPLTDVEPRNRQQVEAAFEERSGGDGVTFLVCADDGESLTRVGEVAFPWINQPHGVAMLMYWAAPDQQGNGYITEATELLLDYAFGERGLHKVWAAAIESNEASQAVLEGLGFEQEGHYRKELYHDGEYVDSYRYAVLADEWLETA